VAAEWSKKPSRKRKKQKPKRSNKNQVKVLPAGYLEKIDLKKSFTGFGLAR
jgi:hypothetical protein